MFKLKRAVFLVPDLDAFGADSVACVVFEADVGIVVELEPATSHSVRVEVSALAACELELPISPSGADDCKVA